MEKLGQLRAQADADGTGTSSSSTPRRPARRWTSSTRPSGWAVPRRPADPDPVAPAKAGGRAYLKVVSAGLRRVHQRASTKISARRSCRTCQSSSPRWTRCSAASASAPSRPTTCSGAGHGVPRRGRAGARRAARGVVLRRAARRRADAARRPRGQPGAPLGGAGAHRGAVAGGGRARSEQRGGHAAGRALLRLHAERMQLAAGEQHLAARFTAAHPGVPVVEVAGAGRGRARPRRAAPGRRGPRRRLSRRVRPPSAQSRRLADVSS